MRQFTSRLKKGFSLVEVVMSIGVVALAFIPLLGLIPSSLHSFRESMDTAIGSQIAQKIINEAIQTDFDTLVENETGRYRRNSSGNVTPSNFTFLKPYRYFDEQGSELPDMKGAVYHVLTRINPQAPLPSINGNADLRNLAQVTVQVVTNPSNRKIPIVENCDADQDVPLRNMVDPAKNFPAYTAVALVPRNQ